jgi:hypothetical protein
VVKGRCPSSWFGRNDIFPNNPDESWPQFGRVVCRSYSPSLMKINLDIEPRTATAETYAILLVLPLREVPSPQTADTRPQILSNELTSNLFVHKNLSRLVPLGVAFLAERGQVGVGVVPWEPVEDVMAVVHLEGLGSRPDPVTPTVLTLEPIPHKNLNPTLVPLHGGQQLIVGQFAAHTPTEQVIVALHRTGPFPEHLRCLSSGILKSPLAVALALLGDLCQDFRSHALRQELVKFPAQRLVRHSVLSRVAPSKAVPDVLLAIVFNSNRPRHEDASAA